MDWYWWVLIAAVLLALAFTRAGIEFARGLFLGSEDEQEYMFQRDHWPHSEEPDLTPEEIAYRTEMTMRLP